MTTALATAWDPRGETTRFTNLLPQIQEAYNEAHGITPKTIVKSIDSMAMRRTRAPPKPTR